MRARIGQASDRRQAVEEVTTSEIRRWVLATLDDSPLWYDNEYAAHTRFGPGCAPCPFTLRATGQWKRAMGTDDPIRKLDFDDDFRHADKSLEAWPVGVGSFHAGNEVEYLQFATVGDVISVVSKIVAIEEKMGRSGRLAVVYTDHIYTNQHGDVLSINHGTSIAREMPSNHWASTGTVRE